jgi:adenylosuccinate lyase
VRRLTRSSWPAGDRATHLAGLAERTKDALLPGRTHGQHAVPATFGFKVAVWIDELCRHVERPAGLRGARVRRDARRWRWHARLAGELGLTTQEKMAARLGMRPMPCPRARSAITRPSTSRCSACSPPPPGKIGREIYTLMKQEFGEVEEPVPPGTVGSSTMPQKRNPEALAGHHRRRRRRSGALVPLALEAMQTEHEADRTTSIMMSRRWSRRAS